MILALMLALQLAASSPMQCDTTTETALKQAISDEPSRLVRVLDGKDLQVFVSSLISHGYLTGSINLVDRIYIVDAGKRPGYTADNVWVFFVQDGCLIAAIPATKSIIVEILP